MEDRERIELENKLEELESQRARHTELITVYVPAGYDLNNVSKQLEQEKSTASNIKSKTTQKNVIDALEMIVRQLKLIKKRPKNGLAIFAGNVAASEGQKDLRIWVIEPPEEIGVRLYRCDQTFVLDPLKELLEVKEVYGLFVIERKEAAIGLLEGKRIKVLQKLTSGVPGKIRAGGQSSQRFHRITEGLAKDFFRRCALSLKEHFFDLKNLKGILVGGPIPTKDEFLRDGQLVTALKDKVIAVKDIGYADEHGLELLVQESKDVLAEQEITKEKKLLETLFNKLGKEKEKTAYGEERTKKALDLGAVDVLYLSKKLDKNTIKEFERMADKTGSSIVFISDETSEGGQFLNLSGIAAILRFQIE